MSCGGQTAGFASLLDDPTFSFELDRIDLPIDSDLIQAERAQQAARERFAEGLGPAVDNDIVTDPDDEPADDVEIGLAGFLVMMTVGGAAAAIVFADRVALLLK